MTHNTNFLSLSSALQTKLIESDWLVASHFPAQDDPMPTEDRKRWGITYHTHNVISGVVRIILDLTICTIVAPVGLFWHTGCSLFYGMRQFRDVSNRHWECAGAELIKVIVLVSIVLTPFLLKVTKKNSAEQQVIAVLGALALMALVAEIGTTLFTPAFNSRYLNGLPNDNDWSAKMALKWELGLVASKAPTLPLDRSIESFANEVLNKISEIQRTLPPKHRLPFDPNVDIHKISRYLEESREDLMREGKWEEIKPLRDQIVYYGDTLNQLISYKTRSREFPIEVKIVTNAYQGNFHDEFLPALELVKTRPPRQLHIYSLTQILFKKMLESNWLYPSNYESREIPDKGSIEQSMLGINPYDDRQKITSKWHTYLKPFRYFARSLGSVGVVCIGIPGGTLYNGVQSLRYVVLASVSNESFGNWEKAKAYALAALNDLTTFPMGFFGLPFVNETMLMLIATRADRSGLFKSITLKNNFGITGLQGKLLSYHYDVDVPKQSNYDRYFLDLRKQRSLTLWNKLNRVYNQLSDDQKPQMVSLFNQFKSRGDFSHLITLFQESGISQQTQDECRQIFEDLVELRHLIGEAFYTTESSLFDKRRYHLPSDFPYYAYTFSGFDSEGKPNSLWEQILKTAQDQIRALNIQSSNLSQVYLDFKKRVMAVKATPESILELEELTQSNVNQAYKKIALHVHPDKVEGDENLKDEAKKVFQLLQDAKTILDEKCKHLKTPTTASSEKISLIEPQTHL